MSNFENRNREKSVKNESLKAISKSEDYAEIFKQSFPDAKKLSDNQRKGLLMMLHDVLVEVRSHGFLGKSEQVSDLADAFHNLPAWLTSEVFSFDHFRDYLRSYHRKHPDFTYNYSEMLDKIEKGKD